MRLTHPRSSGIKTGYWSPNKKDEPVERLAEYEDTGVTPQEIYSASRTVPPRRCRQKLRFNGGRDGTEIYA